jgi:hypothetical protein
MLGQGCVTVAILCMFLALCSSSLKASLLNINSEKEDFPESTIEDIKGWCNTHLIIFRPSVV